MKYKISKLAIVLIVLTIAPVFAFEFDNMKNYDPSTKTAIFRNTLIGIPTTTIGTAQLLTAQHRLMFPSDYAFEIEFNMNEEYSDSIKAIDFYNKQSMDKIGTSSNVVLKYYDAEGEYDETIYEYKEECVEAKNDSKLQDCEHKLIGTHVEKRKGTWKELSGAINLPTGKTRVRGYYPELKPGQTIEWIPTLFGIKVEEWADFTGMILYAHYDINDDTSSWSSKNKIKGQTFTSNESFAFGGISVKLVQTGNTGQYVFYLYNADNTGATYGSILSNGSIDGSSVTTNAAGEWYNISMSAYTTNVSGRYTLVFGVPTGSTDLSTSGSWREDETSPSYTDGTGMSSDDNGTSWTAQSNIDRMFQIYGGVSSGIGVTLVSPSNGYSTILKTIQFNCSASSPTNVSNISLIVNDAINYTATYSSTFASLQQNLTFASAGTYNYSCMASNILNITDTADYRNFTLNNFVENSQNFSATSLGGSAENFKINLTYDNLNYGISAFLYYNNTIYGGTNLGSGSEAIFSANLVTPIVTTATVIPFYWNITLSNSTSNIVVKSNNYTQLVSKLSMDNCTTGTIKLLNFTMIDEESLELINGTIEITANLYSVGTNDLITTFNGTLNYVAGQQTAICIDNINQSYKLAYSAKYYGNSSLYFKKYRNVQNLIVTNNTIPVLVPLYNLLGADGNTFKIIVVGNILSSQGNANLVVDVQKQYLSLNRFISVESPVTDTDGETSAHLIQSTAIYNFLISSNGNIIGTFNNFQVQCQNAAIGQCTITLNLAQSTGTIPNFVNYGNISTSFILNNATKVLYFTFNSIDGNSYNITEKVFKSDAFGNTSICYNNIIASSSTLICAIPTQYQTSLFYAEIYSNGVYVGTQYFNLVERPNYYGVDILIEMLMFTCLVLMMLSSPILIVIGAVLGIVFSSLFLYLAGGTIVSLLTAICFYVLGGVLVIWQISKRI